MKKNYATIFVLIAAASWGTMGAFIRVFAPYGFSQFQLALFRSLLTAVSLLIFFTITDRNKLVINIKDVPIFIGAAIVSVVIFNYCYFSAIRLGTMSLAATLLYTAPIFVTLFSAIFFAERITKRKIVALIVSFLGCIFVSGVLSDSSVNLGSIIFGLASGLTYGLYSIFSKIALRKYSAETFTTYTFLFAAIFLIPIANPIDAAVRIVARPNVIFLIIIFAFITNIVPYLLYTVALNYIEVGKASITATLEPVVATIIGSLIFKESMSFLSYIGVLLVISSSVILNININKKKSLSIKNRQV